MPRGSVVETFGTNTPYVVLESTIKGAIKNLVERVLL